MNIDKFGFVASLIGLIIVMFGVYHQSYLIAAVGCFIATIRMELK